MTARLDERGGGANASAGGGRVSCCRLEVRDGIERGGPDRLEVVLPVVRIDEAVKLLDELGVRKRLLKLARPAEGGVRGREAIDASATCSMSMNRSGGEGDQERQLGRVRHSGPATHYHTLPPTSCPRPQGLSLYLTARAPVCPLQLPP